MIDLIISVFKESEVNTWIIIIVLILGYLYREGIRNFFSEKLLEKQKLYDEQRDVKQTEFQEKLLKQNAELQKSVLSAIENQKKEIQKELNDIDYKRDYYKKIIDHRIEAYEKLSIYLDSIWTKKRSTALEHETEIYSCFENEEELLKANQLLLSYCPGIHWYSEDVYSNYYNLARYLVDTLDVLKGTKADKTVQAQYHCKVLNDHIADTICKLKIAKDRISFDKVEDFFYKQKQRIERVK